MSLFVGLVIVFLVVDVFVPTSSSSSLLFLEASAEAGPSPWHTPWWSHIVVVVLVVGGGVVIVVVAVVVVVVAV